LRKPDQDIAAEPRQTAPMQRLATLKPSTAIDYRSRLARVLRHLAGDLDGEHSLAELARIAHFSPFHFHRIFRGITGESVAGLVRRLRLERAALALRRGETPIITIALDAGYGSPEAFARAFEELGDRPCLELYLTSPALVPEEEQVTKVCVPLRG
jgi:AraC-like DNA-binding protein